MSRPELPVAPVTVRFKNPEEDIAEDLKAVAKAVLGSGPWVDEDIAIHKVSGGITNLLYRLEAGGEVRSSTLVDYYE